MGHSGNQLANNSFTHIHANQEQVNDWQKYIAIRLEIDKYLYCAKPLEDVLIEIKRIVNDN